MKFSVAATTLAVATSALAAQTVITATNEGHVYTKTVDSPDSADLGPGEYFSTLVVTRGDVVYTKYLTATSSDITESSSTEESSSEAPTESSSSAEESSSTEAETTSEAPVESSSTAAPTETSTADVSTYTGGAALASVGAGLLGVAVAGLLI